MLENVAATSAHEGAVPELMSAGEDHVVESPEDGKYENHDSGEYVNKPVDLSECVHVKIGSRSVYEEDEPATDGDADKPSKDHVPVAFLARRSGKLRELALRRSARREAVDRQD